MMLIPSLGISALSAVSYNLQHLKLLDNGVTLQFYSGNTSKLPTPKMTRHLPRNRVVLKKLMMLPRPNKSTIYYILFAMGFWFWGASLSATSEELAHFEKSIRPLLIENCIRCHGPEQQYGGLKLDSKKAWQKGGKSSTAIIPGNANDSLLVKVLSNPNHPKVPLSPDQITDIKIWIQSGASDPRVGNMNRSLIPNYELGKDFWSFQPIPKPTPARLNDSIWPRTEIDKFIRAKQEDQDLVPVSDASKTHLVRRAYFTLIGLPPTPEKIDAFVNDSRHDAFEALVDELLASSHFGERWGRHWLDVARFAESSGGGRTLLFKDAWRFRDYVIKAFNNDMPFDQMVREQLAGDLLPWDSPSQRSRQLTATAFLTLGPTNYELQDKQLLRYDVIDEQIDTIGKAFMGMTLGCARCHDHKFDPVPTSDYYALAGIFKSTRTLFNYTDNVARWIDTYLPQEGPIADELAMVITQEQILKPKLNLKKAELAVLTQHQKNPPAPGLPKPSRQVPGIVIDERIAEVDGEWMFSQYSQNYLDEGYYHDGNELKGQKTLTFKTTIPVTGLYEVRLAYAESENRSTRTPIIIGHAEGETKVIVNQKIAPSDYGRFYTLGEFYFVRESTNFVRISTEDTDGHVIADAVQWFLVEDSAILESQERNEYVAALKEEVKGLESELKPLNARIKSRPKAMVIKEDPKPTDSAIRIRGVEKNKGEIVPRGFLQVATLGEAPVIQSNTSGRRELAEWILSKNNPLTARVMANRIWSWLFGTGIVRSVDNFGTTGELPSHPELLDYLAIRLVENEWSIKALVKEIILSRTWQLSAKTDTLAKAHDPDNHLLTSYPRRRLDAEQLRDAILSANSTLDLMLYGPNINEAAEIDANSTGAQAVEYSYVFADKRRSVYTPAFRVNRHELFELFDFGNVNFSMGQRNVSTVALQALYMLNNPFMIEQSRVAAKGLLKKVKSPEDRIKWAYRTTLGRLPTKQELALVNDFLKDGQSAGILENWASVYQSLYGSIDFRYLN